MLIVLILLSFSAWFAYLSYSKEDGFNLMRGMAALMGLISAGLMYLSEFTSSLSGW